MILLVGCWAFYGSFVATGAARHGKGFLLAVAIGVPVAWKWAKLVFRRPLTGVALACVASLLMLAAVRKWGADFALDGIPWNLAGAAVLIGAPLLRATQWAWQRDRRRALSDRQSQLVSFDRLARWTVDRHAPPASPGEQQDFAAAVLSGWLQDELEQLLSRRKFRKFDRRLAELRASLREFEQSAGESDRVLQDKDPDPYEVLMCDPEAPFEVVKQAYKAYAKYCHPDSVRNRGGDEDAARERMKAGNLAFEEIKRMRGID